MIGGQTDVSVEVRQVDGSVMGGQTDGSESAEHGDRSATILQGDHSVTGVHPGGSILGSEIDAGRQVEETVGEMDGSRHANESSARNEADGLGQLVTATTDVQGCEEMLVSDDDEMSTDRDIEVSHDDQEDLPAELLVRKWSIRAKRRIKEENLHKQAGKMLRLSNKQFEPAAIGDNVRVQVPEVDRSKCSSRNIIGVVMEIDEEKSLYKIGTSQGVLNSMYSRREFEICKERFVSVNDVPSGSTSVRACHTKSAIR